MTRICVSELTIIGSEDALSTGRDQAIISANAGILLIGPLRTKLQWNLNQNPYIFIQENVFKNIGCDMATIWLVLNVLTHAQDAHMPMRTGPSVNGLPRVRVDPYDLTCSVSIKIQKFPFNKKRLKKASASWWHFLWPDCVKKTYWLFNCPIVSFGL